MQRAELEAAAKRLITATEREQGLKSLETFTALHEVSSNYEVGYWYFLAMAILDPAGELCDAAQEIAADTAYLAHDYPRVVAYRRLGGEIRKAMREETAADAATLDRFERTNPQNFHTWKLLGEYYRSQGDDVRAAQCFDTALQSGIPRADEREAVERLKSECKP